MATLAESSMHKLPKDCYPPTDSEDESFVILPDPEREFVSMPVNDASISSAPEELLCALPIDRSLSTINDLTKSLISVRPGDEQISPQASFPSTSSADCKIINNGEELNLSLIQKQIQRLALENSHLKETLQQNNLAMKTQCDNIKSWQEDMNKVNEKNRLKYKEAVQQISQLKNNLTEKSIKIREFEEHFKLLQNKPAVSVENGFHDKQITDSTELNHLKMTIQKLEAEKITFQQSIKTLNDKNGDIQKELSYFKNRTEQVIDKAQSDNMTAFELKNANDKIKMLETRLNQYKSEITKFETQREDMEAKSEEARDGFLVEIAILKEKLHDYGNLKSIKETNEMLFNQLTELQVKFVDLSARLQRCTVQNDAYQVELNKANEHHNRLKVELTDMCEKNVVLEEQAKIIKEDFEKEREDRENARRDETQAVNDMRSLRDMCESLKKELNTYKLRNTSPNKSPGPSSSNERLSPILSVNECPLCAKHFRSLKLLEEHVQNCLDSAH